jgi:hypothetical protein
LAEVDRQIAEVKAQLAQGEAGFGGGDDPSLWPLRKKLVALYNEREQLDRRSA